MWCAFAKQLDRAARKRDELAALAVLAQRQGGVHAGAFALVAGALVDVLDALVLPVDAGEEAGASAYDAFIRALGRVGLPKTASGSGAVAAATHELAGAQPPEVVEAAAAVAELCGVVLGRRSGHIFPLAGLVTPATAGLCAGVWCA